MQEICLTAMIEVTKCPSTQDSSTSNTSDTSIPSGQRSSSAVRKNAGLPFALSYYNGMEKKCLGKLVREGNHCRGVRIAMWLKSHIYETIRVTSAQLWLKWGFYSVKSSSASVGLSSDPGLVGNRRMLSSSCRAASWISRSQANKESLPVLFVVCSSLCLVLHQLAGRCAAAASCELVQSQCWC